MPRKPRRVQTTKFGTPWRPYCSKFLAVLGAITYLVFSALYALRLMHNPWWILCIPGIWVLAYLIHKSERFAKVIVSCLGFITVCLPMLVLMFVNFRGVYFTIAEHNAFTWNLLFLQGIGIVLCVFFLNNARRINWSLDEDPLARAETDDG